MARASAKSPFDVMLVSNRALPERGLRQFVFDVKANRQVQRYTINAINYERATDALAEAVQANVRNAGDDVADQTDAYYSPRDSSRVSGGVIATIAVATIAAQWVAVKVLRWLAGREEDGQ